MDVTIHSLMLRLTRAEGRAASAAALATFVGASELVVFAVDPEVNVLLPAPGFSQTLTDVKAWRAFLDATVNSASAHRAPLSGREAVGIRGDDGTVMVLLGGAPRPWAFEQIAQLLPFIGAVFVAERLALSGKGDAMVARASARKAEELTASLARTQAGLNTALGELHQKQEWLSTTLKSIGDAVIVTDAGSQVMFINAVAGKLTGWAPGEAKGRPLSEVFRIHNHDSRAVARCPVNQALTTGEIVGLTNETFLIRKDLTEVFIDDSAAPIRNEAGRVTGAVLVFRDITARKRIEDEERKLRVKERVALEFEQQLIGIVSHDLRNPLAAMLMAATLLEKMVPEPAAKKVLARIATSGQRASRMIGDLLDFTQARFAGGLSVSPAPMDLHDVMKQGVDEARLANPDRTIEVSSQGSGRGCWDADRIAQLLGNLLSNALRYSPPATTVQLRSRLETERMVIEVHNDGPPIPAHLLPHLYEPMKRGDEHGDHANHSIGLGLYIVRHVALAHRGTVSVSSDPEHGTTFTVWLPV